MCAVVFGCITPHPPVLVPEVGGVRTSEVEATIRGLEALGLELAEARPEALLLVSPHGAGHRHAMGVLTAGSSGGSFMSWGTRGLDFAYKNDLALVQALLEEAEETDLPLHPIGEDGYDLDWGVLVPMYFLGGGVAGTTLTPLTFSALPLSAHLSFGHVIHRAAARLGRRVAVIASGDLSHRLLPGAPAGYDPLGQVFDQKLVDALRAYDREAVLNLDRDLVARAGECGLRSIVILLGALEGLQVTPKVLSYEGPFGVGYLVASFRVRNASVR
ncbi:MAG TPA: class III extradiol dioxygenase subunit B-like domain-containing protein [Dehalococcoidia bacterium]|nr:class III extradiol dioxygenase subunit B-like domain-containing protein [Dehalococcoidia bacterium]